MRWIVGRMYQLILPMALLYDEPEPAARTRGLLIESARAALSDAQMEDFTGDDDAYGGAAEFLRAAFMQCGFDYRDPVIAESLMLEIQRTLDEKAPTR